MKPDERYYGPPQPSATYLNRETHVPQTQRDIPADVERIKAQIRRESYGIVSRKEIGGDEWERPAHRVVRNRR